MSRALSTAALQAIFAQETSEALFFLITLDHSSWASPVRLVNNNVDIVSRGNTYFAFPVEVTLPAEGPGQGGTAKLTVCNVSQEVISQLRALSTVPTVTVEIILASTPDTVEAGPFEFELQTYTYDQFVIGGTLAYEDVRNEPIPADTFNPAHYPGLFGNG